MTLFGKPRRRKTQFGLTSVVRNKFDKKDYAVSTIQSTNLLGEDVWQTAIALVVNKVNDFDRPLFISQCLDKEESRNQHRQAEHLSKNSPRSSWPELPEHITSRE